MDNPAFELLPRACDAPPQGRFSGSAGTLAEAAGGAIMAGGPTRCSCTFSTIPREFGDFFTVAERICECRSTLP